jgi:hypothetical protein
MPSASSSWRGSRRPSHVALALLALLVDQALDLLVLARVQRREGEVLELPLDRVDAEPVRQRRVDLEGLLGLLDLLLLGIAPSVRMLCRRSASLMRMTRMSVAIATIILR